MSFEKIISIPGLSGLFKMVAQMRNGGFVVESLVDNRRVPVSAMQRIVMLKDISIYTTGEDMPLYDVMKKMKENDVVCSSITAKADAAELKSTLKKVLPEFDENRVHVSDIRKMFTWYAALREEIGSDESEKAMNKEDDNIAEEKTIEQEHAPAAETEAPVKKKAPAKKKKANEDVAADLTTASDEIATPKKKAAKKTTKAVE